jgi:hypothetical protein
MLSSSYEKIRFSVQCGSGDEYLLSTSSRFDTLIKHETHDADHYTSLVLDRIQA